MIKKFIIILFLFLVPLFTNASGLTGVMIGNNYYDNLEDAIRAAGSNDVIKLLSDMTLEDTILIDKVVNIDLNGNDILAPSTVFKVQGGTLNLSGSGMLKETEPNYGVIRVIGSSVSSDNEYSVVNVSEGVILDGWSGIFITHDNYKSYGVTVNFSGEINAVDDINGGSGAGFYVNGNIQHQENAPVINILDGAKIYSSGTGLYIAGYSIFNIGDAYISGVESGIGIKSGILNIDGAQVVCTGEDDTPTEGDGNGIKSSGTTIQIESNSGYAGDIELNISDGNFTSKNSNVIYEYIGKGNSTEVKSINISNGTFISENNSSVFRFSDSFNNSHGGFVSGGKYSSDPTNYLASSASVSSNDGMYVVTKSSMKLLDVMSDDDSGSVSIFTKIFAFIVVIGSGFLIYFNRSKISNVLKRYLL